MESNIKAVVFDVVFVFNASFFDVQLKKGSLVKVV